MRLQHLPAVRIGRSEEHGFALILVMVFPELATWLPDYIYEQP
ncbi:MAG: hypothetical protein ABGY42_16790 [bacterium]